MHQKKILGKEQDILVQIMEFILKLWELVLLSVSFVERSLSTGTETRVPQYQWNGDKLDGTGHSGLTLDTSKAQILWTDVEWLGLGTVRDWICNQWKIYSLSFFSSCKYN